jgi:hypothetical protein
VGAVGAIGTAALALPAGTASAASRPPAISGGSLTISQQDGQTTAGVRLNTPFGQTPLLTLPTAPSAPAPPTFPVTTDPSVIMNDPFYQGLANAITSAQSSPQVTVPPVPEVTFNPPQPVPFTGISAGTPGLLPSTPPPGGQASGPAAPVTSNVPAPASQPSATLSGSVSGAFGLGGTAGLACDNGGNCALTLGVLGGLGGSARLAISPTPAPTTLNVDAGAQASTSAFGYGLTGGVSGSLTNFTGLQAFGRVTTPGASQLTVSGTIPSSTLAGIGLADSNAAAAEAGLPVFDQPVVAPSPNQQVSQAFADLAALGGGNGITFAPGGRVVSFGSQTTAGLTVTIPITRDYLNQVGQALGNADMMAPAPEEPSLTPAQRIDQGFSAVGGPDAASVIQQDFAALGGTGAGAGAGGFNTLPSSFPTGPASGQQAPVPYLTNPTTPNGSLVNPFTAPANQAPAPATPAPAPADQTPAPAPATPAPADQAPAPATPAPAPADQTPAPAPAPTTPVDQTPAPPPIPPIPPVPVDQAQPPAPGPQTQLDPVPAAPSPDTSTPVTIPDTTASSPPLVAAPDPTSVSAAPAVSAPPPVSAGLDSVGPIASGGGFSGGGSG